VIQNFNSTAPIKIWNQRSQLLFLTRNLYLILTWFLKLTASLIAPAWQYNNLVIFYRLGSKLYSKGFTSMFIKVIPQWKFFNALNINKSLEYWLFKSGNLLLDASQTAPLRTTLCLKDETPFLNQYYSTFQLSNISLHKKPFRAVVFRHLTAILIFWQNWGNSYNVSFKFMLGAPEFRLLYFYNMYIFKIYHL
jgi:hypothetical protein